MASCALPTCSADAWTKDLANFRLKSRIKLFSITQFNGVSVSAGKHDLGTQQHSPHSDDFS